MSGHQLPAFPLSSFPPLLHEYCRSVAETTQTPPEMAAMMMLGALSTVALGVMVDAGNGWTEEIGLYTLIVMGAAERKSSVMKAVCSPLRAIERRQREEEFEELEEERLRLARFEARKSTLLRKIGQTDEPEARDAIWEELRDVNAQINKFGELADFRLLADDVTAEGLTKLLDSHGRIGILAAEGSAVDNIVTGQYSNGKPKLDIVLKGYGGEPHTVDRKNGKASLIPRPLLSVTLAIQEPYLEEVINHPRSRALGLVSRFSFVIPRSLKGDRDEEPPGIDPFYADGWEKTLTHIHTELFKGNARQNRQKGGFVGSVSPPLNKGGDEPLSLSLHTSARKRLKELQRQVERGLGPTGELTHIADWAGRHLGRILRIAGLLHLAALKPTNEPIDLETFARAEEIGDFLMAHGRYALEEGDTIWLRVLHVLEKWEPETIKARDLQRRVFHADQAKDEVTVLIARLVESEILELIPAEEGRPGRPSPTYKINRGNL